MDKRYEFIHFVEIDQKPKTKVFSCRNNKSCEELGVIKWYPSWRQYCFFPTVQAVYSAGCLRDIECFISELKPDHPRRSHE